MEGEKILMNVTRIAAKHPDVFIEQSGMRENVQIIRRRELPVEQRPKLKVAAYCRVSTDREEQETSIKIQMETYQQIIEEHPDWELAEIYADPGATGLMASKRPDFLRMIEDAKAGKIDIILAKSISRFARNTEDMLKYTRMLRSIGVGVIFEKEKIDTRSSTSEMLLTIYAAFSQEESHDISEWSKVGIRNDAARGKTRFHKLYGYTSKGKDKWIVVPDEAEIVRRIFNSYIKGASIREIAEELNAEGIPTKEGVNWKSSTLSSIIQNEKYAGDYLFQKTYVDDFLTKRSVNNTDAKLPQYYITDNHEALVSKEVFAEAQEIMHMRNVYKGANLYPYYGFLICPECGTPLVCFVLQMQTSTRCWVCPGHKDGVKRKDRADCKPFTFYEKLIDEAVRRAILGLKNMKGVEKDELEGIQEKIKENGRIERWYLKTLVKNITFPDYEHLTVNWKDGRKVTVPLTIKRYWFHPYPEIGEKGNGYIEYGGEQMVLRRLSKVQDCIAGRNRWVQELEITMPDAEDPIQVPVVRKGK
jgi:Site-specific recombinases, DNA invertase Pin homologs